MKVLFLTSGAKTPSSRFRVHQYVPFLEKVGIKCLVAPLIPNKYYGSRIRGMAPLLSAMKVGKRVYDIFRSLEADVIFLERDLLPLSSIWPERLLFRLNSNIIFDFDDAIFLKYKDKIDWIIRKSKVVITGNDYLAAYANQYNRLVLTIPTSVDLEKYKSKDHQNTSEVPVIGWVGTSSNLCYLAALRKPLAELSNRYNFLFDVVSDDPQKACQILGDISGLRLTTKKWSETSEINDLLNFDIGVMPLRDAEWEKGKCALKLIQYMALGIPSVASPVGENAKIISNGENGFLASSDIEWKEKLERLLNAPELRLRFGVEGRKLVEQNYSIQANFPSFLKALEYACE